MANVWKVGSRWSDKGSRETSVLSIFRRNNVVFVGSSDKTRARFIQKVKKDDFLAIADGRQIVAIAKAISSPALLKDLKRIEITEADFNFDYDVEKNWVVGVKVNIVEIDERDYGSFHYWKMGTFFAVNAKLAKDVQGYYDKQCTRFSIKSYTATLMDSGDKEISEKRYQDTSTEAYSGATSFQENGLEEDNVSLETCSLGQLFSNPLIIPDYQRNYCWEEKQVKDLWQSLKDVPIEGKYHLGTIILQKDSLGNYAIIDGQQRLVTLTLICRKLGYKGEMPLLKQTFRSAASRLHVANNRFQIDRYCKRLHDNKLCGKLINNLIFSVLILTDSRLDLAYTFFSNENSKGVPLTDYDLLKAHHLRFVFNERQAEHVASKWNSMTSQKYHQLDATLSTHLFRLRKWMRKRDYDAAEKHRTKDEFSAAQIIPEIPPFGEQFEYYEKIQGGTHFFAYAEYFVKQFEHFEQTKQVVALRQHLQLESHPRYEEVIETLLFGYYLKFGSQYLSEALFCIAGYIAQHRYTTRRALSYKIREFAKNSEIAMMIDQASSPTFFLAECLAGIKLSYKDIDEEGIELRFYQRLQDMFTEINDDFTDYTIIEHYNNEYA